MLKPPGNCLLSWHRAFYLTYYLAYFLIDMYQTVIVSLVYLPTIPSLESLSFMRAGVMSCTSLSFLYAQYAFVA